jgi:hypothetical protein
MAKFGNRLWKFSSHFFQFMRRSVGLESTFVGEDCVGLSL